MGAAADGRAPLRGAAFAAPRAGRPSPDAVPTAAERRTDAVALAFSSLIAEGLDRLGGERLAVRVSTVRFVRLMRASSVRRRAQPARTRRGARPAARPATHPPAPSPSVIVSSVMRPPFVELGSVEGNARFVHAARPRFDPGSPRRCCYRASSWRRSGARRSSSAENTQAKAAVI